MSKIKVGVFRVPSSVDEPARNLIRKMMVVKPDARISVGLLNH